MAFCNETVNFPYFTVSRVYRDTASMHYAFVGMEMSKKHSKLFKNMSNGNVPLKNDITLLKNIFGDKTVELWISIIESREPLIFINDMIWTDDTIFKIKAKLFVYLTNIKKSFILPAYQQLWVNINNKNHILGFSFEKDTSSGIEIINYLPAVDDIPKIDSEFVTEDDERIFDIRDERKDNMLLYDIINNISNTTTDCNRIFLYVLLDEIEWLQNNPIIENKKEPSKTRIWNGYFKKHWPIANPNISSFDSNIKLYNDIKKQIFNLNDIISTIREQKNIINYPKLQDCFIWKMMIYTRPSKLDGDSPFRLDMIYNYLRTLLSSEIPFIYYIRYGDKEPNISIYEQSIKDKSLLIETIKSWIFKKLPTGQEIPHGRAGTILLKLYNYSTKEGIAKYINVTLFKNSEISIGLSFEEFTKSSIKDIENTILKVTKLISNINNNFLSYHNHPLYSVPELKINNGKFIFSEYTSIQFYQIITVFYTRNIFDFDNFSKFIEGYKPFVTVSLFSNNKDTINLNMKYNRVSEFIELPVIFEFIEKEKTIGTSSDTIIELITKRFGKTKTTSYDIYNDWRILQTNKQVAKELLKRPGVNIEIKKADDSEDINTNKEKKYKYKIFISGLKSLYILRNCYHFLKNILSFYYNTNKKSIIKKNIIANKNINIDFGIDNENNLQIINNNVNNVNNVNNISNNLSISTNFNENIKPNRNNNIKNNNLNFSSIGNVNMTNESEIDPKIRLKCSSEENRLYDKGTCKDICDFPKFKLNRLQHFEPKIFRFKAKRHNQPYSRQCEEPRRPIVMAYDPSKNPKIDKNAFTHSIKYKSSKEGSDYYYICPQAWCPICEIPISMEKLSDIKTKMTKDGLCEYAKCPNGKHDVIINSKGMKEIYPGFLNPVQNPNGFCMPCCFKNNKTKSTTYKRCVDTDENNENKNLGKKYISRRDKIPLAEGRLGLLPEDIENFLEQKNCYTGNIKSGFNCLVRKGIKISKTDSFINVLIDLVSGLLGEKITKKDFIKRLTISITDQLFHSLSSGLIKRQFTTKENYINFLLTTNDKISKTYIWDLVSRPGIFTKEGFNIVIFTPHSVLCPFGQKSLDHYSLNKPTLLVVKYGNTYEPIYNVKYSNNNLEYTYLHNSLNPVIEKAVTMAKKGCESYDEIYWNKASNINRNYEIKESISLTDLIKNIEDKYTIKLQLIDNYSKTTGVILNNGLYIPIKPSIVNMEYPYLNTNVNSEIPLLSFEKTILLLKEFNEKIKLHYNPIYLIVHKRETDTVIGILLETNRIIPIIPVKISKIKTILKTSNIFYYPNINSIQYSNITKEKRIQKINEYQYKIEAFERFKYELSRYLQTIDGKKNKDKIIKIIENQNIKKNKKELEDILTKIIKKIVDTSEKSKNKMQNIIKSKEKYIPKLLRTSCYSLTKKDGDNDAHCICTGKSCKLIGLIKSDFIDRLSDILLRYPIEREEILHGTLSMINLSSSLKKHQTNEILLTGNKIDNDFNKLIFSDKNKYYLQLIQNIDMTQPTFEGVNKKAYLRIRKGMEKDIKTYSIVDLSQHWLSIMSPAFRMISTNEPCDSLYYSISEFANQITKKFLDVDTNKNKKYIKRDNIPISDITITNIKDIYCNFLLSLKTDEIQKIVKNVIKDISKEDLDEIIDVSDFYNKYHEKNNVNSIDELVERIKVGKTSYKPDKFDVIMLSYMINIKIILLRSSISEVIGDGYVDNEYYSVLFYDPNNNISCIKFYILQKNTIPYVSTLKNELKRLITT